MRAFATLSVLGALFLSAAAQPAYRWNLPPGAAPPPVPANNPMTAAKVELGHQLFYDADLSLDGTLACATCHGQRHSFAETNASHPGVDGSPGRRNAMSLANVAYLKPLTWADPTLTSLEAQVAVPIEGAHPVEMGFAGRTGELTARLAKDACYQQLFRRAFPERQGEISMDTIAMALASFERTFLSYGSDFDRARRGLVALSDAAKRGGVLFFSDKVSCVGCHSGPAFSDSAFHDIGTGSARDQGLIEKTSLAADAGKFRTTGLRNVALSAPYLHNGSARTLADAISRHRAPKAGLLTPAEVSDLAAFLGALTDPQFIADKALALPKRHCERTF